MSELFYVRIIMAIIFLSIASYQDIKTRHINNFIWYIMFTFGFFFLLLDIFNENIGVVGIIFVLILMIVSIIIYKGFNSANPESFGGADLRAFVCIAIFLPIPFIFGMFPFSYLVIVIAELFAFVWYFPQAVKLPKDEWNTIKFPLIPFLLFGVLFTFGICLLEINGGGLWI
jgi:hypothetical protein